MVIIFQVKNTQELPTLKSLISYNNQINDNKNHVETIVNQLKLNNNDSNADDKAWNHNNDSNTDLKKEYAENAKINDNFQEIKIPVRIIDDQNMEINNQFAVLQLPRTTFNSSLRGNVFKIEIIDQQKDKKNFKNQFNIELNDKLIIDDNNNGNNYDNNEEDSLKERRIREDLKNENTLNKYGNELISTSIKPTTLRRSDITIPKSPSSLRGFFITKKLEDITEAIVEDITEESDSGIKIGLPLDIITTESELSLEKNWINETRGFLESTTSIIDDSIFPANSTSTNSRIPINTGDIKEKIVDVNNSSLMSDNDDDGVEKVPININSSSSNFEEDESVIKNIMLSNVEEAEEKLSSYAEGSVPPKNKWRKRIIRKRPRVQESVTDQLIAESELEVNRLRNPGASLRKSGKKRSDGVQRSSTTPRHTTAASVTQTDNPTTDNLKVETLDQNSRAQELAVSVADPPNDSSTESSKRKSSRIRESHRRTIETRIEDVTDVPAVLRTTAFSRQRQRSRSSYKSPIIEVTSARPRRPAVIDYDYQLDEEVQLSLQRELKDKLYVTPQGGIRCLDQGNFAHPASCKKFINCARMVNGQMISTEYTCPDRLSFDPIGGICNWSAGLGCKKSISLFV